jgi:hypothetical protein
MEKTLSECDMRRESAAELSAWYADAWLGRTSFQNLFDRLRPHFAREPEVLFLGDHKGKGDGRPLPGLEGILGEEGVLGGHGGESKDEQIEPVPAARVSQRLVAAVALALAPDPAHPRDVRAFFPDRSVVCRPGRRELFLMASGHWPLFYSQPVFSQGEEEHRVHFYIDVSASTKRLQPFLYSMALHLGDLIGQPAYLFSNEVSEVSLSDLSRGLVRTTHGTDFDCVVKHAVENRFAKILLVTDGMAEIEPANKELIRARGIQIYLMMTEDYEDCPLLPLARQTWNLSAFGALDGGRES